MRRSDASRDHRHRPQAAAERGRVRLRAAALRDRRRDGRRAGGRARLAGRRGRDRGDRRRATEARGASSRSSGTANARVFERALQDPAVAGMGTTATVALVDEEAGDDRARPRRRLARLPLPRRRARAADERPLARRRARALGPADGGRGGRSPAPLGDHARSRHRAGGRGRHDDGRRRSPATCCCSAPTG